MKIYFKRRGTERVALLTELNGDVYAERVVRDLENKTVNEVKDYLITVGELNDKDELEEI